MSQPLTPDPTCGKRLVSVRWYEVAEGWTTDAPCRADVDTVVAHNGLASARISHGPDAAGRGASSTYVYQRIDAAQYRGKRVAFSAYLRTSNVTTRAQLTFNIVADTPPLDIGRDQMDGRFVSGTSPWTKYELVLDVPGRAFALLIGFEVEGPGNAWMDDAELRIVSRDMPSTVVNNGVDHFTGRQPDEEMIARRRLVLLKTTVPTPTNLGFEKGLH